MLRNEIEYTVSKVSGYWRKEPSKDNLKSNSIATAPLTTEGTFWVNGQWLKEECMSISMRTISFTTSSICLNISMPLI